MKKTQIAGAITTAAVSLVLLSGCSGFGGDKSIVTMKGGNITEQEYYNKIKSQSANEQVLQQMIIYKVADERYGDKISDKQVNKEFEKVKKQYGSKFNSLLKENGYTVKSYKEELKDTLAVQKMLRANVKVSAKDIQKAWKSYHPEVKASIIQVSDENKAKDLANQLKDKPDDFASLAKKNSIDSSASKGGEVSFSSASTDIPANVQEEAWKLKDGELSGVITAEQTDPSTMQTVKSYYIIRMDKQSDKGDDYKKYEKQLKQIVTNEKLNDASTVRKIMQKELKAADVKIKDSDLDGVLSSFMSNNNTTDANTNQ